jgi:uncharacterized integral membrane protein
MIRKILTAVILVPLAIILVMFAVANRETVTVSFDPFSATQPAYAASMPLFVLIFILLILGVLVGGAAAWLRQSRWRQAARRLDIETRRLRDEVQALRAHDQERQREARTAPLPPLVAPPPV